MSPEKTDSLKKNELRFVKSSKALKKNLQRRKKANNINIEKTKIEYSDH